MFRGFILLALSSLFLSGCFINNYLPIIEDDSAYISESSIPKGAIQVDEDLYYIPINYDKNGCLMYRPYSKNKNTFDIILYEAESGDFTTNSQLANCQ
jgi:hypothetical protein